MRKNLTITVLPHCLFVLIMAGCASTVHAQSSASVFQATLMEADQKNLATLASAHEMDLGSGNPKARQHFAAWQRLVAKALGGLPSKGPAKDVTEMIGRGFETLTDKLEQKLERDQV